MTTLRIPIGQHRAPFPTGAPAYRAGELWLPVDISTYQPMTLWVRVADLERLNPDVTVCPVHTCAEPPAQVISLFDSTMVEVAA